MSAGTDGGLSSTPHPGSAMLAAVIGSPVGHSLSPAIHNAAFGLLGHRWHYFAADIEPSSLASTIRAVRNLPFGGLSVTTPLKREAIAHLDECTPEALALGAVNCIVVRESRLVGHNTDGAGCCDALESAGADLAGTSAVVLGAGGTARAVALELCRRGATVLLVNRTRARAEAALAAIKGIDPTSQVRIAEVPIVRDAAFVREAAIVVNATSVGMNAVSGVETPVDITSLRAGQFVLDAVYSPLVTPLLSGAGERGCIPVDGLWLLVHQAVRQQELWFEGEDIDRVLLASVMRAAAEKELELRRQ